MQSTTSWDSCGGRGGRDGAAEQATGPSSEGAAEVPELGTGWRNLPWARREPSLLHCPPPAWWGHNDLCGTPEESTSVSERADGACFPGVLVRVRLLASLRVCSLPSAVGTFYTA